MYRSVKEKLSKVRKIKFFTYFASSGFLLLCLKMFITFFCYYNKNGVLAKFFGLSLLYFSSTSMMFIIGYSMGDYWFLVTLARNIPIVQNLSIVRDVPNPIWFIVQCLVFKPFVYPITEFFSRIFGRIFGVVEAYTHVELNEPLFLYKMLNNNYKLITNHQNQS